MLVGVLDNSLADPAHIREALTAREHQMTAALGKHDEQNTDDCSQTQAQNASEDRSARDLQEIVSHFVLTSRDHPDVASAEMLHRPLRRRSYQRHGLGAC